MQLSNKTLEMLRIIINGDGTNRYRSGSMLVSFFNQLGFTDVYGRGFPSRKIYTDDKLQEINGTPKLDECIKMAFAVIDFIGKIDELDQLIETFNQYMAFDKWQVVRDNEMITFKRLDKIIIPKSEKTASNMQEEDFLKQDFDVNIDNLRLDTNINEIIKCRLCEVEACIRTEASLAAIFMIGSILEGILLGIASSYPRQFNQAKCAPKDADKKVKSFPEWKLSNLIDAAAEIGILKQDVKKFSHVVRDLRNYIHPYQQMDSRFSPDNHTAMICFQVLKAAIYQIGEYRKTT